MIDFWTPLFYKYWPNICQLGFSPFQNSVIFEPLYFINIGPIFVSSAFLHFKTWSFLSKKLIYLCILNIDIPQPKSCQLSKWLVYTGTTVTLQNDAMDALLFSFALVAQAQNSELFLIGWTHCSTSKGRFFLLSFFLKVKLR